MSGSVLLPELNVLNFINGVLGGWTIASCSIVYVLQRGPPGRFLITGQMIICRVQILYDYDDIFPGLIVQHMS